MSDYRPTSILNSLSKIYERAMSDWLMEFLNNNRILSNFQFGFRKHFFPQIAVAQLVNNILIDLAKIKYIISLFSFFLGGGPEKCFLYHSILLNKLHHYGIRNNWFNLIKCYLNNRKQLTVFNNHSSQFAPLATGVPQGLTLG